MTRLVGKTKSMEMCLTGDPINAQEAYRIGLVNQVVPPDKLEEAVNAMVKKLISKGAVALDYTKKAVNKTMNVSVYEAIDYEKNLFSDIFKTEDAYEMTARLAKEEGLWVGLSSGAAFWASLKLAESLDRGIIVAIFPDGGNRYITTAFSTNSRTAAFG